MFTHGSLQSEKGIQKSFLYAKFHKELFTDNLGPFGRLVRHALLWLTLSDTWVLQRIQQLRTPFLTLLMKRAAFLVSEEFYILLVLGLLWCGGRFP